MAARACPTTLCHELRKNGWTDRDAICVLDLDGPAEACVTWGRILAQVTIEPFCQMILTTCFIFQACTFVRRCCLRHWSFLQFQRLRHSAADATAPVLCALTGSKETFYSPYIGIWENSICAHSSLAFGMDFIRPAVMSEAITMTTDAEGKKYFCLSSTVVD